MKKFWELMGELKIAFTTCIDAFIPDQSIKSVPYLQPYRNIKHCCARNTSSSLTILHYFVIEFR